MVAAKFLQILWEFEMLAFHFIFHFISFENHNYNNINELRATNIYIFQDVAGFYIFQDVAGFSHV